MSSFRNSDWECFGPVALRGTVKPGLRNLISFAHVSFGDLPPFSA
eukprot:CAMPEP_0171803396 /NCGR_PEP_ID=MMETSP0991-20121206/73447_1 /TAXON_ID=483369 /ORGANISM="non described non described, Strain CCMP2098" /LENGTH=44 /DNA_ID= /DNA_START= /DNA_END= /DNA_ORIENTATION=